MSLPVFRSRAALRDVTDCYEYLCEQSQEVADRFVERVADSIHVLSD